MSNIEEYDPKKGDGENDDGYISHNSNEGDKHDGSEEHEQHDKAHGWINPTVGAEDDNEDDHEGDDYEVKGSPDGASGDGVSITTMEDYNSMLSMELMNSVDAQDDIKEAIRESNNVTMDMGHASTATTMFRPAPDFSIWEDPSNVNSVSIECTALEVCNSYTSGEGSHGIYGPRNITKLRIVSSLEKPYTKKESESETRKKYSVNMQVGDTRHTVKLSFKDHVATINKWRQSHRKLGLPQLGDTTTYKFTSLAAVCSLYPPRETQSERKSNNYFVRVNMDNTLLKSVRDKIARSIASAVGISANSVRIVNPEFSGSDTGGPLPNHKQIILNTYDLSGDNDTEPDCDAYIMVRRKKKKKKGKDGASYSMKTIKLTHRQLCKNTIPGGAKNVPMRVIVSMTATHISQYPKITKDSGITDWTVKMHLRALAFTHTETNPIFAPPPKK